MNFDLTHVWDSPRPHILPAPPAQKFVNKTLAEGGNTIKFAKVFTRESFQLVVVENLHAFMCKPVKACLQAQTLM